MMRCRPVVLKNQLPLPLLTVMPLAKFRLLLMKTLPLPAKLKLLPILMVSKVPLLTVKAVPSALLKVAFMMVPVRLVRPPAPNLPVPPMSNPVPWPS